MFFQRLLHKPLKKHVDLQKTLKGSTETQTEGMMHTCSDLGYVGALKLEINNRKINFIMKRAVRFVKYDIISQLPSEFFSHAVTSVFLPSVCRSSRVSSHGVH